MTTQGTDYWHNKLKELGTVIVIPTYNNYKTLAAVLEDVQYYASDIIVVNDGATDETALLLKNYTTHDIITHPQNKGKGAALKSGLLRAGERGFRYAITIDSDGQHFAADIPLFIEEIEKHPDALLVGARNLEAENMPGKNSFANKFSNFWYKLETGISLKDTQSGYRLYPLNKMGTFKHYTAKYEFELEAIVFAAWKGVTVKNINIHVYYPPQEERVSHFRPIRDFTRISLLNTVLVLVAALWIWPRNFFRKLTWGNIKKFFYEQIIYSKESNLRLTLAIMLGVFMGIVPVWGYQMLITLFLARAFKLNTVIAIVAANISIPPIIPLLLYGSYATGCFVLNYPIDLDINNISLEHLTSVLQPYLIGSFIFAGLCSLAAGILFGTVFTFCRKRKRQ